MVGRGAIFIAYDAIFGRITKYLVKSYKNSKKLLQVLYDYIIVNDILMYYCDELNLFV